jgi:RHS repeat-associated protein
VTGYYLSDDQASVMATINPAGSSATRYLYEPYGEQIRTWTDPNPGTATSQYTESTASAPSADVNPWRYAAGYYDKNTGFLKFGTRYYMPQLGTWTQPDPKVGQPNQPLTLNSFGYAASNPPNVTDLDGRAFWDDWDFNYSPEEAAELFAGVNLIAGGAAALEAGVMIAGLTGITFVGLAVGIGIAVAGLAMLAFGLYLSCDASEAC